MFVLNAITGMGHSTLYLGSERWNCSSFHARTGVRSFYVSNEFGGGGGLILLNNKLKCSIELHSPVEMVLLRDYTK
jgi:hypothetical protein